RQHRGSAIHKAASMAYWRKWTGLELPTAEEAQDVAATEFRLLWDMGVRLDVDEAQRDLEAVGGEALGFVVDVAAFHVRAVAPLIEPIAVERRITVTPRNSDLVIDGILDLIDRVPANPILSQAGGEGIRDLKTSVKSPNGNAADSSQQLTIYGLVRLADVDAMPADFVLDHVIRTPAKGQLKHIPQHTTRDRADFIALVERLNVATEGVKRGVFIPADPSSWQCSEKWCEYWSTCKYTRRSRRPTN